MNKITSILITGLIATSLFVAACGEKPAANNNLGEAVNETGSGETAETTTASDEKAPESKDTSNLITTKSAGKVKLGVSIAKVREAIKPLTLRRDSDGEGIALIAVQKGNKMLMLIYAGEEDPDAPINDKAIVEHIEVFDSSFKTEKGVHPGMKIGDAEAKYGKVKEIMLSEIESREYADFVNQPKGFQFRLSSTDGQAGVYEKGSNKTTKYTPNTKVDTITVLEPFDSKETSGAKFTSSYTSLSDGCKSTGGEEGGHVSTTCKGPGGYQVTYFDSATTLQFAVETSDGKKVVDFPTQSLSYDTKKGKVEFRLADGKPFAVIMRSYGENKAQHLMVKGLKGFESIDSKIDVRKTKNANEAARKVADEGYSK